MKFSVISITHNNMDTIQTMLLSLKGLSFDLFVSDYRSTDGTRKLLRKIGAKVFFSRSMNLGERLKILIRRSTSKWVFLLSPDERISSELKRDLISISKNLFNSQKAAYIIPFQNHVFGKAVFYGGESYSRIRLFNKDCILVIPEEIHEELIVRRGSIGKLQGTIHHHSYRTPWQMMSKFTRYAWITSGMLANKRKAVTLKKLFLYGPHMVWARLIKEQGYRDGWRGLVLALMFGYMEGMTYWFLLFQSLTTITRPR